jgi:hypothetical protein
MIVIPALGRLRQDAEEFEASLGYSKKQKKKEASKQRARD